MKDDKTVKGSFGSSQARFKTLKNNDASIFERGPLQIGTIGNK